MINLNKILKNAFDCLSNKGISVLPETLKKYKYQGWMSNVYTVESDKGRLIIHVIKPVKEHQKNKVWEKFHGLAKILSAHPKIPTSEILYTDLIKKNFIIVQFFIPGNRAGKRILSGTDIYDNWKANKKAIVPKILSALAEVHRIQLKKFGWPTLQKNTLEGKYETWHGFLKANYIVWTRKIIEKDRSLSLNFPEYIGGFFKKTIAGIKYNGSPVLVHGDAINPGNILVGEKNKIAILDWEWSILTDPAWEFTDLGWWDQIELKRLAPYFKAANINNKQERIDFIGRIKLYIPFWLLWGTYMHAEDEKPDIYIALRKLLLEKIKRELCNK